MNQQKFAAFDIDGTLIRWQFFHAIVHELGESGHIDPATHAAIKDARMRWKRREEPEAFRAYEKVLVSGYLQALEHINEADHESAIEKVFEEYRDQFFTFTHGLLKQLKADGYLIFAISGSHTSILARLATYLGIDDFLGAEFVFVDGVYTGEVRTPVHDKATALKVLIDKHGVTKTGSVAIGDSESDIAMLAMIEEPIAFNPARGLYEHAKQEGWKIVIERKNVVYELTQKKGAYILEP